MAGSDDAFEGGPVRSSGGSNGDGGGSGGTGIIDPATLASGDGDSGAGSGDNYVRDADGNVKRNRDGSPRKKRGKKSGGSASAGTAKSKDDLAASIALMSHAIGMVTSGIAMMTNNPEIVYNSDEANLVGKPLVELMDFYSVVPSKEFTLWLNLGGALVITGAPRYALIRMRKAEERAQRAKPVYDSPNAPIDLGVTGSFTGAPN